MFKRVFVLVIYFFPFLRFVQDFSSLCEGHGGDMLGNNGIRKVLVSDGGTAYWNDNNRVASWAYLGMLSDLDTVRTKVLKLMIVRQC